MVREMAGRSTGLITAQLCSQFVSETLQVLGSVSHLHFESSSALLASGTLWAAP